jgi:hypothetical protein
MEGACGLETPPPGSIVESHTATEHFQSLDPAFTPRPPARADLRAALEHLLDQMCASQYPAHPDVGAEITRPRACATSTSTCARRSRAPCRARSSPTRPHARKLMHDIAVALKLGEQDETHFVIGRQRS